jgi:hypothetical protein
MTEMTEKEIDEVDGALWGLIFNGDMVECETTVYKFTDKETPMNEDIGSHKYHVLTFKPMEAADTIEFMKAHIGDVRRFIDNHAKSGYNGLMVKDGCVPKKTVKDLIRATSKNFDIPEKYIRSILAQV